jgi:peroxiredoxin
VRTKSLYGVFLFMSLCCVLWGGALFGGEKDRIYFSLSEAVKRPDGPLLLVFFSLDCHVCWEDLIEMKYFIEKNSVPIEFIGISKDAPAELEEFLDKYSFSYPLVCDRRKELYRRFKVKLEPVIVILKNGTVLYQDNVYEDFSVRREKVKRCLLEIASK